MKKEQKNCCANCDYYSRYYSIQDAWFRPVYYGHCINYNVKNHSKSPHNVCELWTSNKVKTEALKQDIEQVLKNMEKHLDIIKQILSDLKNPDLTYQFFLQEK